MKERVGTRGISIIRMLSVSHSHVKVRVTPAAVLGASVVPGSLCPLGWKGIYLNETVHSRQIQDLQGLGVSILLK